jgi:hypothetical protein
LGLILEPLELWPKICLICSLLQKFLVLLSWLATSTGGLIAREFLALKGSEIAGMVFVDTNTENTRKELPSPIRAFDAIAGELDYYEITGLNRDDKIDPELWKGMKDDVGASEQERAGQSISFSELAEKRQFERQVMGDHPVVVIRRNRARESRMLFEAAVEKGTNRCTSSWASSFTRHQVTKRNDPHQL